jgi:ribonuclease VapC
MVIDTSALIAILLREAERDRFIDAIAADPVRVISAVNGLETALVIEARKGDAGGREYDLLLHRARIDVVPFTQEHLELARSAWRKYGKGKHPASLNFCDCCAYALSKASGEPLLFKGADFRQTDATPAAPDAV